MAKNPEVKIHELKNPDNPEKVLHLDLYVDSNITLIEEAQAVADEMVEQNFGLTPEMTATEDIRIATMPIWNEFIIEYMVNYLKGKNPPKPVIAMPKSNSVVEAFGKMMDALTGERGPSQSSGCGCPICQMKRAARGEPEPDEYDEGATPREIAEAVGEKDWRMFDRMYDELRNAGKLPANYPRPSQMRNPA